MRFYVFILAVIVFITACTRRPVLQDLPKSSGNSVDHSRIRNAVIESSPNAAAAPYELQFLDTMIAQHEAVIDMAQLAQTRAGQDEVKSLARSVIAGQRDELAEMRQLREKFFAGASPAVNVELPGISDAFGSINLEKLDDLKEKPFDLEFIREMLETSGGSVRLAQDAISRGRTSAETTGSAGAVRQFAADIVNKRSGEISQMREWQVAWSK